MLACATTFALQGITARRVTVEVDVRNAGLPAFTVVGLADRTVREARERVAVAIRNSGFAFPDGRITVNLAPAFLRKEGPGFDLAIAIGVLTASGQLPPDRVARYAVFGELGLDGDVRPARGTLAVAEGALESALDGVIVAADRASEATLVDGLDVRGVTSLGDVVAVLRGSEHAPGPHVGAPAPVGGAPGGPDLADVHGHFQQIKALTVAAAGGHNLLLSGPPGIGKTMLARRLPSILPPLAQSEAIEVTRIYSVAGLHDGSGLITARPFRAPHHQISPSGLVGGGPVPTPGEVSLAHHGVLFLDELGEFARHALEALRQPLEDGLITVIRAQRAALYPARFMLVASTNPCPCGFAGSDRCECGESEITRYRRRLSGPLLDRIDLLVGMERPRSEVFSCPPMASSQTVREQVIAARERQEHRLAETNVTCNAHMDTVMLRDFVRLDAAGDALLAASYAKGTLSPRGRHRVLRVARTLADLEGRERVSPADLHIALLMRQDAEAPKDETCTVAPALSIAGVDAA